ncbi:putative phosphoribosyltransferase [Streptomyces sp. V4I23]|nr:putative phosphoribosyltransferase [Streptomyces sp. V4I23]
MGERYEEFAQVSDDEAVSTLRCPGILSGQRDG